MPNDEYLVENRFNRIAVCHFAFFGFCVAGNVLIIATEGFSGPSVTWLGLPLFLFFALQGLAQHRTPPRISAEGIRHRTRNWSRYDTMTPWAQVERVWFGRLGATPVLLMLLRDPAAVAGANDALHHSMRTLRARHGADLAVPLIAVRPSRPEIAAAILRYSGGRIAAHPAPVD